ncbi:MAG: penicillin-binding protein [Flavobacteriales bacterium]
MIHTKKIKRRAVLIYLVMILLSIGVVSRTIYTQVFESSKWSAEKYKIIKTEAVNAPRGNIYSDDYSLLATSIPEYEVHWDSKMVSKSFFNKNIDELSTKLSDLFKDKTAAEYQRLLRSYKSKGTQYGLIRRKVDYNQLKLLKTFPIFEENRLISGFIYSQTNKRQKPFKRLAERTIGYDRKNSKSVGLEGAFNFYLKGQDGEVLKQKLAGNEWMPIREIESKPGKDIVTTLNIRFQDIAENALENCLVRHDADYGSLVLMEVQTGEIKAIVNLKKNEDETLIEDYNYAIAELSDPGSTFKLASLIAGLEDGFFKTKDSVNTYNGIHQFYDRFMNDTKKGGYGKLSLADAFVKSSNVGISKLVVEYYSKNPAQFVDRLYSMGLNEPLDILISGESSPNILHPKGNKSNWSGTTLPWMSIGYGIEMTPLQILSFYAAIANDGKRMRPFFVKSIQENGKIEKEIKPQVINPSICSKTTIDIVKEMMLNVVENGTAENLKNDKYKIAGKTGTAQLLIEGIYSKQRHQSSFVGYFPADQPKYACIVVVKDPKKNGFYGGEVAGPVFKELADYVFANDLSLIETNKQYAEQTPISKDGNKAKLQEVYKAIEVKTNAQEIQSDWVLTYAKEDRIELKTRNIEDDIVKNKMPNLVGMPIQDVLFLLENYGLDVMFSGRGAVKSQSITKGSRIQKGQKIFLELS